jgi:hypothetical protein
MTDANSVAAQGYAVLASIRSKACRGGLVPVDGVGVDRLYPRWINPILPAARCSLPVDVVGDARWTSWDVAQVARGARQSALEIEPHFVEEAREMVVRKGKQPGAIVENVPQVKPRDPAAAVAPIPCRHAKTAQVALDGFAHLPQWPRMDARGEIYAVSFAISPHINAMARSAPPARATWCDGISR